MPEPSEGDTRSSGHGLLAWTATPCHARGIDHVQCVEIGRVMERSDYLRALVRGWWLIVIFGLVGLAVGLMLPMPRPRPS